MVDGRLGALGGGGGAHTRSSHPRRTLRRPQLLRPARETLRPPTTTCVQELLPQLLRMRPLPHRRLLGHVRPLFSVYSSSGGGSPAIPRALRLGGRGDAGVWPNEWQTRPSAAEAHRTLLQTATCCCSGESPTARCQHPELPNGDVVPRPTG